MLGIFGTLSTVTMVASSSEYGNSLLQTSWPVLSWIVYVTIGIFILRMFIWMFRHH